MADNVDTTARAWRATRDSLAGVVINKDKAILVGSPQSFVAADARGVTIRGPLSIVAMSNEIRTGGLFVSQPEFVQLVPSTLVTPQPSKLPMPPISGIANIIQDVAFFTSLLV